ncbi:MAG: hypothetical protein QXF26_07460, partial [Candidatus Bathyarchaeia archaeon]
FSALKPPLQPLNLTHELPVSTLQKDGFLMLTSMKEAGERALNSRGVESSRTSSPSPQMPRVL